VLTRFSLTCLIGALATCLNVAVGADLVASDSATPRAQPLVDANAAYVRADLRTAINLYEQVASVTPSEEESQPVSAAITGLARFRALVALTSLGDDDQAHEELQALLATDANAPLARLAAQFWDQYGMTGSARVACRQLSAAVDSQAHSVLHTLASVGISMQHEEVCFVP